MTQKKTKLSDPLGVEDWPKFTSGKLHTWVYDQTGAIVVRDPRADKAATGRSIRLAYESLQRKLTHG